MTQTALHEHEQLEKLSSIDNRYLPVYVSQFIYHCQHQDEYNIPLTDSERKRLDNYYHRFS